jgi:hypothetical protein
MHPYCRLQPLAGNRECLQCGDIPLLPESEILFFKFSDHLLIVLLNDT